MLLNWKRCTQKASNSSPVAQSKVLFTSSFKFQQNLVGFVLSFGTCFPFLLARNRFRNVCCLRKHLTKVVLRFFRLLCFIPILHSKTWVVHMAANIEVTSETKKSSVLRLKVIPNKRETYVARYSPKSPCLSEIFLKEFFHNRISNAQLQRFKASKMGLASNAGVRNNGVRSMVVHLKAPFKLSFLNTSIWLRSWWV